MGMKASNIEKSAPVFRYLQTFQLVSKGILQEKVEEKRKHNWCYDAALLHYIVHPRGLCGLTIERDSAMHVFVKK